MQLDNVEDFYPLSPMQEGMLFHTLAAPQSGMYVRHMSYTLHGDLDIPAFERAWQQVVNRHPALRTYFLWDGLKKPVQVVQRQVALPIQQEDWRRLLPTEQEERLESYLVADRIRGFDVSKAPLMRLLLIRLTEDASQFVWCYHHLLLDGWSMSLVIRDVLAHYEALGRGREVELEPARPYRDYIVWLQQQDQSKAEAFWRRTLMGFTAPTSLGVDRSADGLSTQEERHDGYGIKIPEITMTALQSFARQHRLMLNTLVQGAWALLLSGYSGTDDVVFGTIVAGRPPDLEGVESMVGVFINTLPVRVRVSADDSLVAWLKRLQTQQVDARQFEYSPLTQVQRWSQVPAGQPLFESLLAFENYPSELSAVRPDGRLQVHNIRSGMGRSYSRPQTNYPLSVGVIPASELVVGIGYDCRRFDAATIARLARDFHTILERIVTNANQPLSAVLPSPKHTVSVGTSKEPQADKLDAVFARSNLTRNQLLFWAAQKLRPTMPVYNMAINFILSGQIEPKAFQKAFQTLINSSDALRIVIEETDGIPQQRILPTLAVEMEYIDFSSADDPRRQLDAWVERRSRRPLNFQERLFDAALIRVAEKTFVWYLSFHQIISDIWSASLIFQNVLRLYKQCLEGELPETVELLPFEQYIAYEREYQQSPRYLKDEAYWSQKLAAPLEPMSYYGTTPAQPTTWVQRVPLDLGAERTARLKALAADQEISLGTPHLSLFNVFSTLLLVYLHRLSGQRRLSLRTPFHNRRSKAFRETIGLFMQMVPVHMVIEPEDTFLSLLKKAAKETIETFEHGQYIIKDPLHLTSHHAIVNYMLNYHTVIFEDAMTPGGFTDLSVAGAEWVHTGYGDEPLTLQITGSEDKRSTGAESILLLFDFDCEIFSEDQRRQATEHFLQVVDAFLDDYRQPVNRVCLLTPAEKQSLLGGLNRTETRFPTDQTVTELFEAQVERTPDRIAIVYEDQALTYAQLNARANQWAHHLRHLGVGPETLVALMMNRHPDFLTAILAIYKAGGAYLALDPSHPPDRVGQILGRSQSRLVLVTDELMPQLRRVLEHLPEQHRPVIQPLEGLMAPERPETNLPIHAQPNNLSYVFYTSGSTGIPKGAMVEHGGMGNHIHAKIRDFGITGDDVVAQNASQCFDVSVWQFLAVLLVGGQVHMVNDEVARDPLRLLEQVARAGISILEIVPSQLRAMIEGLAGPGRERPELSTLRILFVMGEVLPPELCRQWMSRYPNVRLVNGYGATECSDDVTHYHIPESPALELKRVSLGGPLPNMRLYVVDEALAPVPLGVAGEILFGGICVGRGYLNDPERTARVFIPDPFSPEPGGRLYKTGDLGGYLPAGGVDFLGRIDRQVKIRGFRIELEEIEAVLGRHPAVSKTAVVAREDGPAGHRLVAYVVAGDGAALTPSELRAYLKERLPDYMVPAVFVFLDALPLNANGKVDRRALPPPDEFKAESDVPFVAPRTPVEEELAQIWCPLLGVERVSLHDNFFELGGHSLLLIQLASRIREAFQVELPMPVLFDRPTLAEMASAIVERQVKQEDVDELAQMLEELKQLTPEQARALLEAEGTVAGD
jgi:amino acid adenylation domain-containing protein